MVVVCKKESVLTNRKILYLSLFIGVKVRRLRMDNQDGTSSIPSLTLEAEHLSTLKTLEEVRGKWVSNNGTTVTAFAPTVGGLFGLAATAAARPPLPITKKRTRTPVM
jgi:hypothetical protein